MSAPDDAKNKVPVLIVATLSSFLTPFMTSSVNIALPSIGHEFAMNAVQLGWVATSYILAATIFLVPLGKLADIFGRKRMFSYGILLFTATSLLMALSGSMHMLIALRAVQGVGGAMIFGTGVAMLISVFPLGERGKALGINVAAVYLGLSVGPFLGGFLTQHFGWRSVFVAAVIPGVITAYYSIRKLKGEWAEARGEKFDLAGAIMYSITLTAIVYGFSILPLVAGGWLILLGIGGCICFIAWESAVPYPVLNINLFRNNSVFAFSNLAALINYSANFAVSFIMSLYLQYIKGLTPEGAGLILISQPIIQALFSPYAGRLSDIIEPRITTSIGMSLTVVGLVLLSFLDAHSSTMYIVVVLMLQGFAFALFSSPNTNAVMSSVEKKYLGVASGTLGTMRLTGQMLGMGITMLVFALVIGRVQITPASYPFFLKSLKILFSIFAVFCFGGTFASMARGKVR
ncbi:MAG: MFS transporter [Deltaproteobacteria bacterium]|nr:MFS transporter [Deltaproteobacteria bacterium]